MLIQDWLTHITAKDSMRAKVVTVWPSHTLAQAAAVMLREQISGLPVVDSSEVCVGVFSVNDILRAEEKVAEAQQELAMSDFFNTDLVLPASVYAAKLEQVRDKITPAAEQSVERFMTTDLVSVAEEAPLADIIQSMVEAHLHRVLVLDEAKRLKGIVATTDILAALLRIFKEGRESSEARKLRQELRL